ncbi:MAG: DNA mismatch repair protein MutS [Thermodesulfobacteriota bacterium]|nr:DNA mismatch repair protein MutS [Thermodesulfobacteriota bacterium]
MDKSSEEKNITKPEKITPMMRQYLEIKEQHQDAILFYRLGDFYEMFFDDAVTASRVLGITLTSRNKKNDKNSIPLCGVPYHAASSYLAKLVDNGFRVAVCEQMEDPANAKGVVKREVVRVVTPGLVTEDQILDDKSNRYIASVVRQKSGRNRSAPGGTGSKSRPLWGLSLIDISTGEFMIAECDDIDSLLDELGRMTPSEILINEDATEDDYDKLLSSLSALFPDLCITKRPAGSFDMDLAKEALLDHFKVANLAGFGCDRMAAGIPAAGSLLTYITETQKSNIAHIEQIRPLDLADFLLLDDSSRRNLELTQTIIGANREGSLLATLDCTSTPMGARLLKKSLLFPLKDLGLINRRLGAVEQLFSDQVIVSIAGRELPLREGLRSVLSLVYDIERLNSRVVLGKGNGRDLIALKASLEQLPFLKRMLISCSDDLLKEIGADLDVLCDIRDLLEKSIREDAPITLRDGRLIKQGYNSELDEIVSILKHGKDLILNLETRERERSKIGNLKIGFNKVFGYYLEVSRARLDKVPDYFIRKQTLVNAERFITPELKEFESKVVGAEEKRLELEYRLFCEIRAKTAEESSRILKAASDIAGIDFLASLGEAARRYNYVRPHVNNDNEIIIREGRHPVIELSLPKGRFVPNDIHLDQTNNEVLIITGPNMAGKSTVLRQTALIVLMAQMGSFVPAKQAEIGIVDRIFTRVGAMDDLRKAQSTFMVEMNETANILNNATDRSLVILDEIGRGTSTFDGLAIAWAVVEDLVNKNGKGVKTIFATHYHEITELARTSDRIKNYNIAVREWNDSIIFLYKLLPGGTNRSYGIQVAALAGVPQHVVARAGEILHNIEKGEFNIRGQPRIAASMIAEHPSRPTQLELFSTPDDPVRERIDKLSPDKMTPLDALNTLYELKQMMVS